MCVYVFTCAYIDKYITILIPSVIMSAPSEGCEVTASYDTRELPERQLQNLEM